MKKNIVHMAWLPKCVFWLVFRPLKDNHHNRVGLSLINAFVFTFVWKNELYVQHVKNKQEMFYSRHEGFSCLRPTKNKTLEYQKAYWKSKIVSQKRIFIDLYYSSIEPIYARFFFRNHLPHLKEIHLLRQCQPLCCIPFLLTVLKGLCEHKSYKSNNKWKLLNG